MTSNDLLVALKWNLEIITDTMDADSKTAKDSELMQYIDYAKALIAREGITLNVENSIEDFMLVVTYAGHLYSKRKASDVSQALPKDLRWALNNRLFSQKIQ